MAADTAARNDRLTAVVLFALGVAMFWGGFDMDRLEARRIHPASIPGLVPMLLGGVLALCATVLGLTASREVRDAAAGAGTTATAGTEATAGTTAARGQGGDVATPPPPDDHVSVPRLLAAALWSSTYALVLLGRMPFTLATALYVTLFVLGFGWPAARGGAARARLAALALGIGVIGAWAIATLFSEGFLVRLP